MFRGHLGWISRFFWFVDCVLGARTDYLNCGKPSASGGTEMEAEAWSASVKRAKSLAFALDHSSELMQYSSCQWDNMFIVLWVRQHTKMNLSGYKGLLLQIALDWIPQTKFAVPVFAGSASAKVSAEEGSKRRQELCFLWILWIFFISLIFSLVNLCRIRSPRRLRPVLLDGKDPKSWNIVGCGYHWISPDREIWNGHVKCPGALIALPWFRWLRGLNFQYKNLGFWGINNQLWSLHLDSSGFLQRYLQQEEETQEASFPAGSMVATRQETSVHRIKFWSFSWVWPGWG